MAGIATGGGPLDRVDRPRGRQEPVDGRLLGQQARPDVAARVEAPARGGLDARAARAAGRGRAARSARSPRSSASAPRTVRHWLKQHGLRTPPRHYSLRGRAEAGDASCASAAAARLDDLRAASARRATAAGAATSESVAARRRRIKEILVAEAGGACLHLRLRTVHRRRCTSTTSIRPRRPSPSSREASPARSRRAREEAGKCVLLCANCHARSRRGLLDTRCACRSSGVPQHDCSHCGRG